jgi:hypothetical protein
LTGGREWGVLGNQQCDTLPPLWSLCEKLWSIFSVDCGGHAVLVCAWHTSQSKPLLSLCEKPESVFPVDCGGHAVLVCRWHTRQSKPLLSLCMTPLQVREVVDVGRGRFSGLRATLSR